MSKTSELAHLFRQLKAPAAARHGGESRIKAARFPAPKTLEQFDLTFQRSVKRQLVEHLGQLDFLHARENVVMLGPPGPGSHCPPRRRHWSNGPVPAPDT
jgi:DNA replication protein DnaC